MVPFLLLTHLEAVSLFPGCVDSTKLMNGPESTMAELLSCYIWSEKVQARTMQYYLVGDHDIFFLLSPLPLSPHPLSANLNDIQGKYCL